MSHTNAFTKELNKFNASKKISHAHAKLKSFTREFGQLKCERFSQDECGTVSDSIGLCKFNINKNRCQSSYKQDSSSSDHMMMMMNKEIRAENPKLIFADDVVRRKFFIALMSKAKDRKLKHSQILDEIRLVFLLTGDNDTNESSLTNVISRAKKLVKDVIGIQYITNSLTWIFNNPEKLALGVSVSKWMFKILIIYAVISMKRFDNNNNTSVMGDTQWLEMHDSLQSFNEICTETNLPQYIIPTYIIDNLQNAGTGVWDVYVSNGARDIGCSEMTRDQLPPDSVLWDPSVLGYDSKETCEVQERVPQLKKSIETLKYEGMRVDTSRMLGAGVTMQAREILLGDESTTSNVLISKSPSVSIYSATHPYESKYTEQSMELGRKFPLLRKYFNIPIMNPTQGVQISSNSREMEIQMKMDGTIISLFNDMAKNVWESKVKDTPPYYYDASGQVLNTSPYKITKNNMDMVQSAVMDLYTGTALLEMTGWHLGDRHFGNAMYQKLPSGEYKFKWNDLDHLRKYDTHSASDIDLLKFEQSFFADNMMKLLDPMYHTTDPYLVSLRITKTRRLAVFSHYLSQPLAESTGVFQYLYLVTNGHVKYNSLVDIDTYPPGQEDESSLDIDFSLITNPSRFKSKMQSLTHKIMEEIKEKFRSIESDMYDEINRGVLKRYQIEQLLSKHRLITHALITHMPFLKMLDSFWQ